VASGGAVNGPRISLLYGFTVASAAIPSDTYPVVTVFQDDKPMSGLAM
jgi:hypothetical protein